MQNNGTLVIFSDMLNSIAQLTKMLIKQQLTGAEKRTYTHLEEKGRTTKSGRTCDQKH